MWFILNFIFHSFRIHLKYYKPKKTFDKISIRIILISVQFIKMFYSWYIHIQKYSRPSQWEILISFLNEFEINWQLVGWLKLRTMISSNKEFYMYSRRQNEKATRVNQRLRPSNFFRKFFHSYVKICIHKSMKISAIQIFFKYTKNIWMSTNFWIINKIVIKHFEGFVLIHRRYVVRTIH